MSGIDDNVITVPEVAIFATDSGAVLGPQDGAGPTYAELAAGWQVSARPPARWLNWLFKAAGGAQRAALGGALSDWRARTAASVGTSSAGAALVHLPNRAGTAGLGAWYAFPNIVDHYYSTDGGLNWTQVAGIAPGVVYPGGFSFDSQYVMYANGASVTYKSTLAGAGTSRATGMSSACSAIAVAFRYGSDGILVGSTGGEIAFSTAVSVAFTQATAAPKDSGSWDSTGIWSLCMIGASAGTALAFTQGGQVWRSTDSGVNWSLLSTLPGTGNVLHAVVCPHTGALVATRENGSSLPTAWYSHDNGATWTACTFFPTDATNMPAGNWSALKTAGGGGFVAATNNAGASAVLWVSSDRGVSWYPAWIAGTGASNSQRVRGIGCDGRRMIGLWDASDPADGVAHSAALDGRGSPAL